MKTSFVIIFFALGAATLFVVGLGFGIAFLWVAVNADREREAVQRVLRRLDVDSRADKEKTVEPVPRSGVWDRDLDR